MAISPPRTSTLAQRGPKRETLLKAIQMFQRSILATAAVLAFTAATAHAGEVEVLHYWTSGGEAKSAAALKATLQGKGHTWKDFAVAGGGGDNAMTVLKSRVVSGNAPAAAQIKGPALQEWAAEGVLANIDDVAKAEKWDTLLPPVVANVMKYKGNYIAAPVNVHRVNWLWASNAAFKKAGAKVPTNWDEFFVAAEALKKAGVEAPKTWEEFEAIAPKLKEAGIIPFAIGGEQSRRIGRQIEKCVPLCAATLRWMPRALSKRLYMPSRAKLRRLRARQCHPPLG